MIKYAKIIDTESGLCEVGIGTNSNYYESIGMTQLDVSQSEVDSQWYLSEKIETDEYKSLLLEKMKNEKHEQNRKLRDERLRAGVFYKGLMFDSDTDSKVNIMGALASLPDNVSVGWNSMDNQTLILTKAELSELGDILAALTATVWGENGLNLYYINAINQAQTIEELQAIDIVYPIDVE